MRFFVLPAVCVCLPMLACGGCGNRRAAEAPAETDVRAAVEDAISGPAPAREPARSPPAEPPRFFDERQQHRYEQLRACVLDRVGDGDWQHQPLGAKTGLMREEVWCRPEPGQTSCSVRHSEVDASEFYQLRTRSGEADGEERLELMARRSGGPGGWDVSISIQPWTGGFDFRFHRGDEAVDIGTFYGFQHRFANIVPPPDTTNTDGLTWLDAEMSYSITSPESLRDRACARLDAVLAAVRQNVGQHTLTRCPEPDSPGRFVCSSSPDGRGRGIRDTCVHRRLSAAEEAELLTAAREQLRARRALVVRHHAALHAALLAALPLDRCWVRGEAAPAGSPDGDGGSPARLGRAD